LTKYNRLPKDEIDNFWDNLYGFLPTGMLLIGSIIAFFGKQTEKTVSLNHKIIFFIISLSLFCITLYFRAIERNLKRIETGLNQNENKKLIRDLGSKNNWNKKKEKENHFEFMVPFLLGHYGHKMTLIAYDDYILYNLRNIGSGYGRMPYLFGIDTLKEYKIKTKINSLIKIKNNN